MSMLGIIVLVLLGIASIPVVMVLLFVGYSFLFGIREIKFEKKFGIFEINFNSGKVTE